MSRRPPATLADYLLVGFNPTLIMFLIGSIVYYLVLMFYVGEHWLRLNFIFAMFIMGAVAVGRISMEDGAGYATMFGGPLAIVSLIALNRFVEFSGPLAPFSILINTGLIALIWWLAYQLTWDCTLLDERADTSDQGLLQATGLAADHTQEAGDQADDYAARSAAEANADSVDDPLAKWVKLLERKGKPHAHGLWVIYVAIVALPIFGLGEWLIARDSQTYAFTLLVLYVATTLALLMSTSFLGLRRYLRNRRISMPLEITGMWLGVGGVLIVGIVLLCMLLPRPGNTLLAKLAFTATSPTHSSSSSGVGSAGKSAEPQPTATQSNQHAQPSQSATPSDSQSRKLGGNSGGDGQSSSGQQSGKQHSPTQQSTPQGSSTNNTAATDNQNQPGQKPPSENKPPNNQPNGEKSPQHNTAPKNKPPGDNSPSPPPLADKPNEKSPGQNTNGQKSSSSTAGSSQAASANAQPQSTPNASPSSISWGSFGNMGRFVFFLVLAASTCYLAWRYRQRIHAAWQQLLKELRELWERWFGQGRSTNGEIETSMLDAQPAAFDSFVDPFSTGQAAKISRVELVRYTFEALQAFGREQGCRRIASETPYEYAIRLSDVSTPLRTDALALAEYYAMAAYAQNLLPDAIAAPLRSLWTTMRALHVNKTQPAINRKGRGATRS